MRALRSPQHVLLAAVIGALALTACTQDDGPSIRAEPETSSTSTTAPTTTSAPSAPAASAEVQSVAFGGLTFDVPADWPVHDLAADPTTCVRADDHAVYLGDPGPEPACPAHIVGHTETLFVGPLDDRRQVDAARATSVTSINGISARVDPNPDLNGALTVIFPDQHLLVIITFGDGRPVADAILHSVRMTSGG